MTPGMPHKVLSCGQLTSEPQRVPMCGSELPVDISAACKLGGQKRGRYSNNYHTEAMAGEVESAGTLQKKRHGLFRNAIAIGSEVQRSSIEHEADHTNTKRSGLRIQSRMRCYVGIRLG